MRSELAWQFVLLSQAVRDFTIEFAVSKFRPDDARTLRNLVQSVIRSVLSIRSNTKLFDVEEPAKAEQDGLEYELHPSSDVGKRSGHHVRMVLREPTRELIDAMTHSVNAADQVIMEIGGQGRQSSSLSPALERLRNAKQDFDAADEELLNHPDLPANYAKQADVVDMLLFIHPVRQTADKIEAFIAHVFQMQKANNGWRPLLPSYPWRKAIMRTNAQVRHDRGGLTAGFYFQSKRRLEQIMADLQSTTFAPSAKPDEIKPEDEDLSVLGRYEQEKELASNKSSTAPKKMKFRYQIWNVLHRLQGFESRFALKVTLVTTLLSVPAWLEQSRGWWSVHQSWWAVVIVWSQMHPRVGKILRKLISLLSVHIYRRYLAHCGDTETCLSALRRTSCGSGSMKHIVRTVQTHHRGIEIFVLSLLHYQRVCTFE